MKMYLIGGRIAFLPYDVFIKFRRREND